MSEQAAAPTKSEELKVNSDVLGFKDFLTLELSNWVKILEDTKTKVASAPDDLYSPILQNAHSLIRACDREVVYMHKLEELALAQHEEALKDAEPLVAKA